jgi:glycosyltransferase involved in cell wall biosynthesis
VLVANAIEQRRVVRAVPPRPLEHTHFLGTLDSDAIEAMLGRASIFVHPARYEPGEFTVLKAALAGCALVLADIPSLREIWNDAAIFVPADDPAALHREVASLIDDNVDRAAWGIRARRAARCYTASRMASEYLAAYRQAMSAPRARRDEENSAYA